MSSDPNGEDNDPHSDVYYTAMGFGACGIMMIVVGIALWASTYLI